MTEFAEFTLAAVQATPAPLNRVASTEKACGLFKQAAERGAILTPFGECRVPGYPISITKRPNPLMWEAAAEYVPCHAQRLDIKVAV